MARIVAILLLPLVVSIFSVPVLAIGDCVPNVVEDPALLESGSELIESNSSSSVQGIGCDEEPTPTTPAFITVPTSSTTGEYSVSWGNSTGPSFIEYRLFESKDGGAYLQVGYSSSASGSNIANLAGRASGSYHYRVRAYNVDGLWSAYRSASNNTVVTLPAPVPDQPNAPTAPALNTTGTYEVSWDAQTNATKYTLQERITGGDFVTIQDSGLLKINLSNRAVGNYYYQVKACNGNSPCSAYSQPTWTKVAFVPLSPPIFTSSTSQTTFKNYGDVVVSWDSPTYAETYVVAQLENGVWLESAASNSKTFVLTVGDHTFKVKACNDAGCTSWSSNHVVSLSQADNIIGEARQRESVSLSVIGEHGAYVNVKVDGNQVLENEINTDFSLTLEAGNYQIEAEICQYDEGVDEFPSFDCHGYGKPFALEVVAVPSVPSSISRSGNDEYNGEVTINWGTSSGEVHEYELYYKLNGGTEEILYSGMTRNHTFNDVNNGYYQYLTRACNTINGDKQCSDDKATSSELVRNLTTLIPEWDPENYGIYRGDFNSNAGDELLILGYRDIVLLHGDIITPIVIFPAVHNAIVSWDSYGVGSFVEFEFDASPENFVVHVGDLDSDNFDEIFLQAKSEGSRSYILSSAGALVQTIPNGYRNMDWSAVSYSINITGGNIELTALTSADDDNVAYTNNNGAITSLQTPVTKPTISGKLHPYIFADLYFEFTPDVTVQSNTKTFSVTGMPSWMSLDSSSGKLSGTPTSSDAESSVGLSLTVLENKNHTIPSTLYLLSTVKKSFTIANVDYDVYEATDGVLYIVSKTTNDVYKIIFENGIFYIFETDIAEFNDAAPMLLPGYQTTFNDQDGDGSLDLILTPAPDSGFDYIFVGNVNGIIHNILEENIERDIGTLTKPVSQVADAEIITNTRPTTSDVVGTLASSARVSNGQVSYNVPIKLPPGRRGMQPQVALSYGSGGGSGVAGVGWQISAMSSVSRCSASWIEDGDTGRANLSDDDRLCLDGSKLILVDGGYGIQNSEYRTREESFRKITLLGGNYSSQNSYFQVIDKSGRETYYGESANSTLVLNGSIPFKWAIERVIDNSVTQNNILYDYSNNGGQFLLTDIHYTGVGIGEGNRLVHFEYENRDDKSFQYISGGLLSNGQRLKEIVSSIDSVNVSKYYLSYESTTSAVTKRTRLESITQCGFESLVEKCLPERQFSYSGQSQSFEKVESTNTIFNVDFPWSIDNQLLGDYNGDGMLDYVRNHSLHIMKLENSQLVHDKVIALPFIGAPGADPDEKLKLSQLDIDGDGVLDILGLTSAGLTVATLNAAQDGFIEIPLGIPMSCLVLQVSIDTFNGPVSYSQDYKSPYSCRADAFPDGAGGFYLFHQSSILTYPYGLEEMKLSRINKSCDNFVCSTQSVTHNGGSDTYYGPTEVPPARHRIFDFDGDGDLDFVRLANDGTDVKLSVITNHESGSGVNSTSTFTYSSIPFSAENKWAMRSGNHWMDTNGDGLDDLLLFDNTWKIYINKGGFFANAIDTGIEAIIRDTTYQGWNFADHPNYTTHSSIRIVDYNGDGLDDFMFLDRDVHKRDCFGDRKRLYCKEGSGQEAADWRDFNITENAFGKYSVYLSSINGTGNVNFDLNETEIEGTVRYFYPIDIDSDGLLDFVGAKWYHDATIADFSIEANPTKVYLYFGKTDSQNIEPDLLLKAEDEPAVDSFGTKDEFEYISYVNHKISNNTNYKVDNSDLAGGDYYRIPTTQLVAVEHRSNNVLSGQNTLIYEYGDSVFHQAGLGFLGFDSVKEIDHAKGITSEAFYRMDYPLNGRMTSSTSRETADNSLLKSETLTWCDLPTNGCNSSGTGVYFVHLDQKSTAYFDVDGNPLKNETQVFTAYDSYGNLTDSTTTLSDSTTTHTTVLSNQFLPANESSWWVNKLDESTVIKTVSYTDARSLRTSANQAKAVTRKVTWKTGNARQLATETHTSNDTALERNITYSSYDSFGNPTRIESSGTAIAGVNYTDVQNTLIREFDFSDYNGYFANSEENGVWNTATVSRTWDIYLGQPLTETAANGTVVTNTYDGFGRIASTETNTTPTRDVVYEWCDANCAPNAVYKQSFIQDGAPTVVEELNIANQVLRRITESFESSNNQVEESFEYDVVGRTLVENLPAFIDASSSGSVQYLNYDVLGRPSSKVTANAPQSYTASYTYSGVNTSISVDAGADGSLSMARQYNFLNQLMSTTDVDGRQAHMRYDANGSPILIEDVDGNDIHASYDSFGNKLSFDDPNNGIWNFRYNALGQLRWQQDAKLTEVRFNYDNLGRNSNRYVNDILDSTWVYDTRVLGALTSESRNYLQKDYYYDSSGRLEAESSLITHGGSSKQFDFNYAYDGYYGRVKGLQFPTGEIEAYNFDNYGYLTQNVDPNSQDEVLRQINAMSAHGKVTSQQYHNGLYDIKTYQVSGESERVCVSQSSTCSGANELAQIFYSDFDNFGNLTDKQEIIKQVSEHYQYDQFHRITRSTRAYTGLDAPTFLPSETVDYDYDGLGNLLLKTDYASSYSYTGGTTGGPNAVQSVTKLDLSQVSFSYDANGNMEAGDGISLTYDSFNKPIIIIRNQVTSSFEYGADDQRYLQVLQNGAKTTTTYYIDKRFEEIETDNNGQISTEKRHYLGDYALLTHKGNTKSLKFIHGDRLGSTYLITEGYRTTATIADVSDLEVERRSFDVFGKPRDALWGDSNDGKLLSEVSNRGFTNHEHLDEVELIHMNGRAFDYNLGRFLSVDPFIQFPQNSQSINGYSYLMNNPLAGTDPSGYAGEMAGLPPISTSSERAKRQQEELRDLEKKITANGKRQQSVGSISKGSTNGGSGGGSNPQITFVGDVLDSVTADDSFEEHTPEVGGNVGVICGTMCRSEAVEVTQAIAAVSTGQEGAITYLHVLSAASGVGDLYVLGAWGVRVALTRAAANGVSTTTKGGLTLFKWKAPTSLTGKGWKEGDNFLFLIDKGTAKLNWKQNSGLLRQAMSKRNPIFDSLVDPKTGLQIKTSGFLNAERNLLQNQGWRYNSTTRAYHPPVN